jgi:hypothetical protein
MEVRKVVALAILVVRPAFIDVSNLRGQRWVTSQDNVSRELSTIM